MSDTATLLMTCKDQKGLVYRISEFIYQHRGNILHADQHIDVGTGRFFTRVEWDLQEFDLSRPDLEVEFKSLADSLGMDFELRFSNVKPRIAIFVSRLDHCLMDLLHRHSIGELHGELVCIVSNHEDLRKHAESYGIPFHVFPINKENKHAQERSELELLESQRIELVILARYMQILTENFVSRYPNRIINIHHSFLPAFAGARPHARAHSRGVKLIGATSHYVTPVVDEGPIIEQEVTRVSHRDTVEDMVRKGRDTERLVLARAVRLHLDARVWPYENKTVVFD